MGAFYSCSKKRKLRKEPKFEETGTFPILNLSDLLREKIWKCLDMRTRKVVRFTCSKFKNEIDLGTGLRVGVDDTNVSNMKFVKSVEVKEAVIHRIKHKPQVKSIFRTLLNVEYLETACPVTPMIFDGLVLPLSFNLVSLCFFGNSLMYKSIVPPEQAVALGNKHFEFPALLALQFDYGHFDSFLARGHTHNLKVFNFNMVTILKSFHCPKLACLVIHPSKSVLTAIAKDPLIAPPEEIEWENSALKSFIHVHRNTLKLLDLFLYAREIEVDRYDSYGPPLHVTDFIIVNPFITVAREFTQKCYWKDIILNSTRLHRLILQIEFWHNFETFFKIIPMIVTKNASTLSVIRLESFALDDELYADPIEYRRNSLGFSLSFKLFSQCAKLLVLEMYQLNSKKIFVAQDLVHLPQTLERLEIKRIFVPSEELELIRLPNLKTLRLYEVGNVGFFGVTYNVMSVLWDHKNLQRMDVSMCNFTTSRSKLEKFLRKTQKMDPSFNPQTHDPITIRRENVPF